MTGLGSGPRGPWHLASRLPAAPVVRVVVGLTMLGVLAVGCSGTSADHVSQAQLASRLQRDLALSSGQARCAAARLAEVYDPDEIDEIYRGGLQAVPPNRWTEYLQAMAQCSYGPSGS